MDKYSIYFILFIAFCCKDVLCRRRVHVQKDDGSKIVGGTEANIESYPHQAYLLLLDGRDAYQCGGSIINRYFIVTAAHCLARIQIVRVRIASTFANTGGLEYATTTFSLHYLYNAGTSDYDVGLVRVNEGMTLDGVNARAIRLVDTGSDVSDGENITVTGWGTTSEQGPTSTTLMVVSVPAVNRSACNDLLGGGITNRMFCAGLPEGGKDSCQGDSGGPAVTTDNGLLAGVTSFGYGCARPNSPGVYSRLGNPIIRSFIRLRTGV